jgi:DNA repair ATPase RecN
MKIRIENFQSIGRAELEAEGLTVLCGDSDVGKSAVVRAVEACLSNKSGDHFIRRGTKECAVQMGDGEFHLLWRKQRKKGGVYEVDGVLYEKTGGTVPDVLADFGFRESVFGKRRVRLQIRHQFEPLFMLHDGPSDVAEVVSSLARVGPVVQAISRCSSDIQKTLAEEKVLEGMIEKNEAELAAYRGVEELAREVADLERAEAETAVLVSRRERLADLTERFAEALSSMERLVRVLEELAEVPGEDVEEALLRASRLGRAAKRWAQVRGMVGALLEARVEEVGGFEDLERDLGQAVRLGAALRRQGDVLGELSRLRDEAARVELEMRETELFMAQFDVCPLCGQPISGARRENGQVDGDR